MLCLVNMLVLLSALSPTTVHKDTLIQGDTAMVITTICAPICSSVARVYAIDNKVWQLVNTLTGDSTAVFPEAYFEEQQLRWRDNTPELLDNEEKNALNSEASKPLN